MGRSFSLCPAYCSSTYRAALFRYASGESSSPLPSARSAIHHALLVPSLCLRSEEHTSELQSRLHLVCRLLLEKKKKARATICRELWAAVILPLVMHRA